MLGGRLQIEVIDNEAGTSVDVSIEESEGEIEIGRERSSRIVLISPSVSRRHCLIEPDSGGWAITDLSSLGTRRNGEPLPKGQRTRLEHADRIEIAHFQLLVSIVQITDPTLKADPMALQRLMEEAGQVVPPQIWCYLDAANPTQHPLAQEGNSLTIGRSGECTIRLPDPMRVVSAFHAKIERSWAGVFLYDTSTNGVYVNGKKIDGSYALSDGDRITVAVEEEAPERPLLVFTDRGNKVQPEPPRVPGKLPASVLVEDLDVGAGSPDRASEPMPAPEPEPQPAPDHIPDPVAAPGPSPGPGDPVGVPVGAGGGAGGGKSNYLIIGALVVAGLAVIFMIIWAILLMRG